MLCKAYVQGIYSRLHGIYSGPARHICTTELWCALPHIYAVQHMCHGISWSIYAVQHMCSTAYPGPYMPCSTCAARHMLGCTAPHMPWSTFCHGICGCAARHKIVLHGIYEVTPCRNPLLCREEMRYAVWVSNDKTGYAVTKMTYAVTENDQKIICLEDMPCRTFP